MLDSKSRYELFDFFCNVMEKRGLSSDYLGDELSWTEEDDYEYEEIIDTVLAPCNCEISYGASKLVLMFPEYPDWVFKIPFRGSYYYHRLEEESEDSEESSEEVKEYIHFCGIGSFLRIAHRKPFDDKEWDYCYLESEITKEVERYHADIADMFAKTYFLGWYGDVPVYSAERCDTGWRDVYSKVVDSKSYKDSYSKCSSLSSLGRELDMKQKTTFVMSHGLTAANELFNFIHETGISDLHSGNLMYDKNNKVRLIDYSGFDCNY